MAHTKRLAVANPATLEFIDSAPCHNAHDLEQTIEATRSAVLEWDEAAPTRGHYLRAVPDRISATSEELAQLPTAGAGQIHCATNRGWRCGVSLRVLLPPLACTRSAQGIQHPGGHPPARVRWGGHR
ncbi:aldehyde dehydrogenase family protein [Rhodococcus opacus]|uniref:aldehyde dehydrogenase family protein n=1 Tax=Rhodococcus opacus TaxID=37919 RepID=UPI00389A59E5